MKSRPELSGVLQTGEKDQRKRMTLGKIALWSDESDNGKAPGFRGILETEKGSSGLPCRTTRRRGERSPPSSIA